MAAPLSWVNGIPSQSLSVFDRGLAYGDGLFETMRYQQGQVALLPWHLRRLFASAARLGFPELSELIHNQLNAVLADIQHQHLNSQQPDLGILKLIVTRGEGGQGYTASPLAKPTCIWTYRSLTEQTEFAHSGVHLCVSAQRLGRSRQLGGLKHLNRLEYVLASQAGALLPHQQWLLLDETEAVIETLVHNIFWLSQGQLCTPELSYAGVAGVMRQWIIEQVEAQGQSVQIAQFSLQDLFAADEVFICNSVRGVWPVTQIAQSFADLTSLNTTFNNPTFFKIGSVARQFQHAIGQLWQ